MKLSDKEIHTANFPLDSRRISRNCALGATTRLTIENFTRHDRFGNVNSQSVSTLVQVDSWNLSFRDLDPSGFPFSPPSCWILFENRATIIFDKRRNSSFARRLSRLKKWTTDHFDRVCMYIHPVLSNLDLVFQTRCDFSLEFYWNSDQAWHGENENAKISGK